MTHPHFATSRRRSTGWPTLRLTLGAFALFCLAPTAVLAQEPSGRPSTHTVREGDTLWDIARTYLGDPFLWPEIYRINTNVVEDPHWIYPGEVLRLPGATSTIAESPTDTTTRIIATTEEAYVPAAATGPTIFAKRAATASRSTAVRGIARREPPPSVRRGEIIAAPYVDREGGPDGAGVILESTALSATPRATHMRLMPHDIIYLRPPRGSVPRSGMRYLAYELGPVIPDVGQLVIPSGVIEIEAARTGEASVGRLVQVFNAVKRGHHLIPLDSVAIPVGSQPVPLVAGPQGKIVWIPNEPVIPSIQHYVVLDASSGDGVRLGDHFTILRRPRETDLHDRLPAEEIAIAQAVRVTRYATTAIIVGQRHAGIREGTNARVTARLP